MKLGMVMDPIAGINIRKDSSFAMLIAAQALDWEIYYMEMADLFIAGCTPCARMRRLTVADNPGRWFEFGAESTAELEKLDIILMRKDPPVDMEYIYITQLLEFAQKAGVCVVNDPAALRDVNEKLFIHWFPDCIAPTLVTSVEQRIVEFAYAHDDIILHGREQIAQIPGQSGFQILKLYRNLLWTLPGSEYQRLAGIPHPVKEVEQFQLPFWFPRQAFKIIDAQQVQDLEPME